jgi:hypothetical protein
MDDKTCHVQTELVKETMEDENKKSGGSMLLPGQYLKTFPK